MRTASPLVLILCLLVAAMTLATCLPGLQAICDDYYYYERIARNLLSGHGSTFDGVVPTNGYQPLWLLFVGFSVAVGHLTHIPAFGVTIVLSALLAFAATYVLGRDLSRDDRFAAICLVAFATYAVFLAVLGMEVTLLLLWGTLYFTRLRATGGAGDRYSGVMLALCFLTRIDAPVYFLPTVLQVLRRGTLKTNVRFLTPLCLTGVVYCVANYVGFGEWVPISGMAKSVTRITFMHSATWASLLLGAESQLMILAACLLTLWAVLAGSAIQRRLALLSFLGVLAFYATTSLRSDWMIWPWYEYPLALHVAQLATLGQPERAPRWAAGMSVASIAVVAAAFVLIVPRNIREAGREGSMVRTALELKSRLAAEPDAVLAMGDRAGAVGEYLPNNRVVQLEGLVMDRHFLESLRHAESILPLLKEYGVSYYVATNPLPGANGCFITVEPMQSKGDSHRVQTILCQKVVHEFWVDGWHTVVFHIS